MLTYIVLFLNATLCILMFETVLHHYNLCSDVIQQIVQIIIVPTTLPSLHRKLLLLLLLL